ncbi:MAG: hypothetical protein OEV41_12420, partial [Gammaproteobacteria bacterium]|nr:hypothetical protein [Gammaproteobacteria bacterium]
MRSLIALVAGATSSIAAAELDEKIELGAGEGEPIRLVRARHAAADVTIDGVLDEPVWHSVETIGRLRVIWP